MKKLIKSLCLAAFVAIMASACQKDETAVSQSPTSNATTSYQELSANFTTKKGVIRMPGVVYVLQQDGITYRKHNTMKFRSIDWSYIQEWFIEDLKTAYIYDNSFFPSDTDGSLHGYYYPWYQLTSLQDRLGESWDELISVDPDGVIPATGFHIPHDEYQIGDGSDELLQLAQRLGSTSLIPSALSLQYDNFIDGNGVYFNSSDTSPSTATAAYIWVDRRFGCRSANIVPGCGSTAFWLKSNNAYYAGFGNDPMGRMNVRLVRKITREQW